MHNAINKNYKRDETNIACSFDVIYPKKNMLIECSRSPLRFSFYSFFFFYKWEIVFQRTYNCKSIQRHFGNLTRTSSRTRHIVKHNFHNWATLLKFVYEKAKTWKESYCINIWVGKLSSFGWSRLTIFFSPNSILLPPKFKIKDVRCM